jgi:thiamine biosynthesis lipoprotein
MEIDLGGIGKEHAVDRVAQLLSKLTTSAVLVNLGGDLWTCNRRRNGQPWDASI